MFNLITLYQSTMYPSSLGSNLPGNLSYVPVTDFYVHGFPYGKPVPIFAWNPPISRARA